MDPIASLARERLVVESVDWIPKTVRTGGVSGPLHDEWGISVRMQCDVPFRGVAFADVEGVRWHARDWARRAECVAELDASYRPHDWGGSDVVQVIAAASGIRVAVKSATLKFDPVASTQVDVHPGSPGWTGVPMSILRIPALGISLGVLLVRSTDTRADRTRWRVRDEHIGGLGDFSFIATGQRSGRLQLKG